MLVYLGGDTFVLEDVMGVLDVSQQEVSPCSYPCAPCAHPLQAMDLIIQPLLASCFLTSSTFGTSSSVSYQLPSLIRDFLLAVGREGEDRSVLLCPGPGSGTSKRPGNVRIRPGMGNVSFTSGRSTGTGTVTGLSPVSGMSPGTGTTHRLVPHQHAPPQWWVCAICCTTLSCTTSFRCTSCGVLVCESCTSEVAKLCGECGPIPGLSAEDLALPCSNSFELTTAEEVRVYHLTVRTSSGVRPYETIVIPQRYSMLRSLNRDFKAANLSLPRFPRKLYFHTGRYLDKRLKRLQRWVGGVQESEEASVYLTEMLGMVGLLSALRRRRMAYAIEHVLMLCAKGEGVTER